MAQETSAPRITDSGPDRGSGEPASTAEPPPAEKSSTRVPLDRLLSVVVLTPAQAALVAVQLLDAIRLGRTTNGSYPADAYRWTATLTPFGDVEVGRAQAGEGGLVVELLEQLCQNARRLPAHPRPEQLVLLRTLEQVAAAPELEPDACARELEAALAEALGSGARQRLSAQLAALVGAFAHIAPGVGVPVDGRAAPGRFRPDPHRAAATRSMRPTRPPSRRARHLTHRRGRTRRTAFALLLVAALAASGYVALQGPGIGAAGALGRDNLSERPRSPAPTTSTKEPRRQERPRPGQDVEGLAPRQAGPITGVGIQRADTCTPGALCPVTVTVRFRPASTTRSVAWKVGAAQLCGSGITWSAPIAVTAQPGWSSVYASSPIPVPPGRSLALVALTTSPARAQSPPMPVTGSSLRCPSSGHAQR